MRFNCVKDIVEEYELNKKHIEIPLATVKKEIEQYKNKIVLYGAGSAGIAFLHYLRDAEIFPQFFSDGDIDKHGKIVEGLEVISPESIVKKLGREALVIVTINTDGKTYCKDFKKELLEGSIIEFANQNEVYFDKSLKESKLWNSRIPKVKSRIPRNSSLGILDFRLNIF